MISGFKKMLLPHLVRAEFKKYEMFGRADLQRSISQVFDRASAKHRNYVSQRSC